MINTLDIKQYSLQKWIVYSDYVSFLKMHYWDIIHIP